MEVISNINVSRNPHTNRLEIDLTRLLQEDPDLFEELIKSPVAILEGIKAEKKELYGKDIDFINPQKSLDRKVSALRSKDLNKLIKIRGILKKVTQTVPRVEAVTFECRMCGTTKKVLQKEVKIQAPTVCSCSGRSFAPIEEDLSDIQEMELEESMEEIGSKQPHKITLLLEKTLTDPSFSKFQVGNQVEIIGVLEKTPAYISGKGGERTVLDQMVRVLCINSKEVQEDEFHITKEEENQIREIAAGNPLQKLSDSIAPTIHGLDHIKKSLVLFSAKGVTIENTNERRRGNIHLLTIGDAGLGKSALTQNMRKKLPNCRTTDGKNSSKAGIVATVSKDEHSGKWGLEAGDLVLANNGYLIIDEADKLPKSDREALHGPMEAGRAMISKAGIHANLSANTSIAAFANPKTGKFDNEKPIIDQIDFGPTLLSRFDLIFVLRDMPDKEVDEKLADTILGAHAGMEQETISADLLKKYFLYISRFKPKLSEESTKKIKSLYTHFRSLSERNGKFVGTPITARHLEGLIRLSQAHAKIRLSEVVEPIDVEIAEGLFKHSLSDFGISSTDGMADLAGLMSKVKSSKKNKYYAILGYLKERAKEKNEFKKNRIIPELEVATNMTYGEIDEILSMMHKEGDLYESSTNEYKLVIQD